MYNPKSSVGAAHREQQTTSIRNDVSLNEANLERITPLNKKTGLFLDRFSKYTFNSIKTSQCH